MPDEAHRIVIDPGILSGKPVVRGTRISVEAVVEKLGRGWTSAQVRQHFPHLTDQDIQACLAYAARVLQSERVYPIPA